MVVGVFPIAKLGALLLRQVSKPIANLAKEKAKQNPFFRTYVCMPPAQFYNWCEVKMKMWALNLGKAESVPSLNEQMAIELGANLLGEGIVFIIAAGVIYFEYARQVRKEAFKETSRKEEIDTILYNLRELSFTVEMQEAQIRQLQRMISDLDSRVMKFPWKPFSRQSGVIDSDNVSEDKSSFKNKIVGQKPTNKPDDKSLVKNDTNNDSSSVVLNAVNYIHKELLNEESNNAKSR